MSNDVMTADEAAEYLRISTHTMRKLLREKEIPAAKIGREWRISKGTLDKMVSEGFTPFTESKPQGAQQ